LITAPVGKVVRYNTKEYAPKRLVARLEALRTVEEATGQVSFEGDLFFDDVVTVLRRALLIEDEVQERDVRGIVYGALFRAAKAGRLEAGPLLGEISRGVRGFLEKPEDEFILATSLSGFSRWRSPPGGCGCRMTPNTKRNGNEPEKEYRYYRCPRRQRHDGSGCPQGSSFRAEVLERDVWNHVWPLISDREVGLATIDRQIRREKEHGNPVGERRRLAAIIEGAETKRARFQHAYAEGAMSLDDLKERGAELDEQCRQARARLAALRVSGDRIRELQKVREMHLRLTARGGPVILPRLAEASSEERARRYRDLGVRVVADPDGQIRVSGRLFPERSVVHTEDHTTCTLRTTPLAGRPPRTGWRSGGSSCSRSG
jgi:hypothetical protein